jgi:uncharacterized protein (DUF1330 family)
MKTRTAIILSALAGIVGFGMAQGLHAQAKPPGYVIVDIDVKNKEEFDKFAPQANKMLTAAGAKYLARGGKTEVFDGAPPHRVSILEFESLDKAKEAYTSADYRALRKKYDSAAVFHAVGVEGQAK